MTHDDMTNGWLNTEFIYSYTGPDGTNYERIVLKEEMNDETRREFLESLLPGHAFIPEELGLEPCRSDLGEMRCGDHPWHVVEYIGKTPEKSSLSPEMTVFELASAAGSMSRKWGDAEKRWFDANEAALASRAEKPSETTLETAV